MVTESAGESELSVALPPSLYEWLDERAAELDIEREALLVQLLETHRSAAELDDDGLVSLFESAAVDAPGTTPERSIEEAVEERLEDRGVPEDLDRRFDDIDGRVDDLEAKLSTNVEDVRERVLQLRDAVAERAPAEHSHEEFGDLSDRFEALSADVDALETSVDAIEGSLDELAAEVEAGDDRLGAAEHKLDRLARAVVALKRRVDAETERARRLDELRRAANRHGSETATCGGCGESVRLGLLSAPRCPHCERQFGGFEPPDSMVRWLGSPTLTVAENDRDDRESEQWQWWDGNDSTREPRDE